jgi:hypothetical protein
VDYINFLETDVVNYDVDCHDSYSHLNASGARKVTDYLGDYMQTTYGITDHRGTAEYAAWDEDYADYLAYKTEKLQEKESLKNYLMLLADKDYSFCIYVKNDSGMWKDEVPYGELFENLAWGNPLDGLSEAIEQGKEYLVVVDNDAGNVIECVGEETLKEAASFGTISYAAEDDHKSLYIGEDETNYMMEQFEDGGTPDVQILVFDNMNGNLIDTARFDINAVRNREE